MVSIASIDRPEEGILGLPRILAQSLGRDIDEIYRNRDRGHLADTELLDRINKACQKAVAALVQEQTDAQGRVARVAKLNFFNMGRQAPGWQS